MKDRKTVGIIAAAVGITLFLLAAFLVMDLFVPGGRGHTHDFKELESCDEESHVLSCRCGKKQESAHEYDTGTLQTEPTCEAGGVVKYTCEICSEIKLQNTDKTSEHSYEEGMCLYCGDIMVTDVSYFEFTLLGDGTYSVAQTKNGEKLRSYPRNIRIPESYEGKPVTAVAEQGFEGNTRIHAVYIPDSVKEMGHSSFYECKYLKYIRVGEGVKRIQGFAFGQCTNLNTVVLPDTLESIDAYAFASCFALGDFKVPSHLNFIGNSAFAKCNRLSTMNMKNTQLGIIEESAFYACVKLRSIVLPDTLTFVGKSAFSDCSMLESANIPAYLEYLGDSAFYNCKKLKSKIVLPDTLSYLGTGSFAYCMELKEVVLPSNTVVLQERIFRNCTSLVIPELPSTLVEIHYSVFYKCAKMPEYLPASLKTIGNYAFYGVKEAGDVKYDGTTSGFDGIELGISAFADTDTVILCTDGEVRAGEKYESDK